MPTPMTKDNTMPRADELLKLAEFCEQATGPDRELDCIISAFLEGYTDITESNGWISAWNGDRSRTLGFIDPSPVTGNRNFTEQSGITPSYTASIDAALTLVPEGYSPVTVLLDAINEDCEEDWAKALPRYVCAVALRARSTGGDGDE